MVVGRRCNDLIFTHMTTSTKIGVTGVYWQQKHTISLYHTTALGGGHTGGSGILDGHVAARRYLPLWMDTASYGRCLGSVTFDFFLCFNRYFWFSLFFRYKALFP